MSIYNLSYQKLFKQLVKLMAVPSSHATWIQRFIIESSPQENANVILPAMFTDSECGGDYICGVP